MSGSYRFGQFALDSRKRTLSRANSPVPLTPKAFDLLLFLAQNPNRLVTKDELLQAVWGDTFVEEGNLTQYISHLRKALSDDAEDTRLIVTIARKGYQFTVDVIVADVDAETQSSVPYSTTESPHAEPQSDDKRPARAATRRGLHGWRAATVCLFAFILVVAGFTFWHFSRPIEPRQSQKIMLAVLPFENLTGDPNKEYLADGLTEEMISQLGRLNPEQLGVIARTSVMGYKHKDTRMDQIGRDLSVQYVLENSLRESGDHIRLTAQLIQVKDQTHLWTKDYDYPPKDILNLEDDVAIAVAREIQLRLTSQQEVELSRAHPVNPEAFDAYMQGRYYFERDSAKDTEMAAKYFERATQLDPSYALAWVGLSRARKWQAVTGLMPADEGNRLARQAVERALALNPNLAEAHAQMGRIKQQIDFDWTGADVSYRRAVELEPGSPETVGWMALSAADLGRTEEALQLAHRALDLDPLNAHSWASLGEIEFLGGKLDDAETDFKKAHELRPDDFNSSVFLSMIYVIQGRPRDALQEIELVQYDPVRTFLYAITYHALGRKKESDAALGQLIAKYHATDAYEIALVYAFRNKPDEAFEWLDRAYANHQQNVIYTKVDPLLKSLHNDPRYSALLKKLNLPN